MEEVVGRETTAEAKQEQGRKQVAEKGNAKSCAKAEAIMTLREPIGDESVEEERERLGLKCEEKAIQTATFPPSPFLLTAIEKEGAKRYFVIDTWEGAVTDIDENGKFTQTFTWAAHKASEEEIEKFSRAEEEGKS